MTKYIMTKYINKTDKKKYISKKYKTKKYKKKNSKKKKTKKKKTKKKKYKAKKYKGGNLKTLAQKHFKWEQLFETININESNSPDISCYGTCDVDSSISEIFNSIFDEYNQFIEGKGKFPMEQEEFIDLFGNLALSDKSYEYYKKRLIQYKEEYYDKKLKEYEEEYQKNVNISGNIGDLTLAVPLKEEIPSLIQAIIDRTGKELCVLFGFSEILSIFGIHFYERLNEIYKLKMGRNMDFTIKDLVQEKDGTLLQEDKNNVNNIVRDNLKFVLSSMTPKIWTPRLNQKIIIDALNDKPIIDKEPWTLINAALCLFMPSKIHDANNNIDWKEAFKHTKCRVTRDEICLISAHKNLNVDYVEITKDWHLYVFTKK